MSYCVLFFYFDANISLVLAVFSPQPDHDPSEDPIPPTKKQMPKRKRKFTKCLDKRAKKSAPSTETDGSGTVALQDSDRSDTVALNDSDLTEPPAPASVRTLVSTRGAKRQVTRSELESNLKSTYRELDNAQRTIAHLEQSNHSIAQKNQELTNTVRRHRESITLTKTVASSTVKQAKGQMKETEDAAATTMKEARAQVKKLQAEIKKLQVSAGERDLFIVNLQKQHEIEIQQRLSAAVEKERVSARMLYLPSSLPTVFNHLHCLCTGTFVSSFICSREKGRIKIK